MRQMAISSALTQRDPDGRKPRGSPNRCVARVGTSHGTSRGTCVTRRASPSMSRGLLDAVVGALIQAGASPNAVAAAVGVYRAWERAPCLVGRPRKYADNM